MIAAMRSRGPLSALSWLSVVLVVGAVVLFTINLIRFSRLWGYFPAGLTIAGIPVEGLDRQQAAQRILEVYSLPVELHYGEAVIQVSPGVFGVELDIESMLAAADQERVRQPFWNAFWDYLWGRTATPVDIPLRVANFSEERLRSYLTYEIGARYDQAPLPAMPVVGTVNFQAGQQGTALDIDRAVLLIENALRSPTSRVVSLPLERTDPLRPAFTNLSVLLKQTIRLSGFDGVIGVYVLDLQSGQDIYFVMQENEPLPMPPNVAFSASSTIKIPVMVSVMRRLPETPDDETNQYLEEMIGKSINSATDWLMEQELDSIRGPLIVTEDMQALGLENTFLAGFFYPGAPLLTRFQTPANQRDDISTEPDPYSQTSPDEIGMLMQDIYLCANEGGGALIAAFPGEITPAKCDTMMRYLIEDRIALLIQAGVPDGTKVAHKHGWVVDAFGVIHDMSDAAIVYTPGGDYVLAVYLWHPVQLVFDPSNKLVSDLSRAVYNFYNLPTP